MILLDANILLYAYDSSSDRHETAARWLEGLLSDDEEVRFALVTLLASLRIATNPSIFEQPLTPNDAVDIVTSWLVQPSVAVAEPTDRHWSVLRTLSRAGQARGPLVMDAHLAALAIEHGATLFTTDRGFARFPRLRFTDPLGS